MSEHTPLTEAERVDRLGMVHPNRDDERDIRPWRPSDGDRRCQVCGRPNVIWYADNALWNRVMPDDGILCIGCFIHRAEVYIGTAAWGLFADPAPFRSEFRRGFEAGQAARTSTADTGLRERVELLRAKYAGRSMWVGYEKPRREAWDEIVRDLREALRGDQ